MQRASGREASVHARFVPICFDRRECLIGLNCNARNNNNANGNDNDSYSLLQKMCARVHVHYARVRVKEGLWGDKGGCTIYELQLNNISEKSSDYCLTTQSLSSTRALVLFYSNYEIV